MIIGQLVGCNRPVHSGLQVIDPHTHQYLDRLKDEPVLLALAAKMCDYLRRVEDMPTLARVSLRRLEHFYHKSSAVYNAMKALTIAQQREQADNAEVSWQRLGCGLGL